jgi:hypothetical protein
MSRERLVRLRSLMEKPLQARGVLRPARLPDFLGIGAQKSGTTWLHAQLAEHPQLFLPTEKEVHYFDWNFHQPLSSYAAHFRQAGDRVAGEITPGYAVLPDERIRFVTRIMPRIRLIYLMRDPVERAWSQVVMNEIELGGVDPASVTVDDWINRLREPRVRRRGDHLAVIDAWSRYVPEDRVLIGFFEDVAADPAGLLARIHAFLGVEARPPADHGVVRRGVRLPMPDLVREALVEMLQPELVGLADRFGEPCRSWLARWTS